MLKSATVLWIAVLSVCSAMPGLVICIGSHGHIAVETAHEDHGCCDHTTHEESRTENSDDSCGNCFDVDLSASSGPMISNSSFRAVLKDSAASASCVTVLTVSAMPERHIPDGTDAPPLSLITQQTVVLRT